MRYKYYSRTAKRKAKKGSRTFVVTLILILFLIYATIQWILPSVIGGVGLINNIVKPSKKITQTNYDSFAPPVINIPFEATNTGQINISGFAAANSKVRLFIDDEEKDTTESSSDGSFEFRDVSLVIGTNNIYGKTLDEKGVESLPSKTLKVFYDNDKPNLSISEPEDGKTVQGGDKKIIIKGKVDPDVKIYINDSRIIIGSDGNFSSEQLLNEGDNTFTVKAINSVANETVIVRKVTYQP